MANRIDFYKLGLISEGIGLILIIIEVIYFLFTECCRGFCFFILEVFPYFLFFGLIFLTASIFQKKSSHEKSRRFLAAVISLVVFLAILAFLGGFDPSVCIRPEELAGRNFTYHL